MAQEKSGSTDDRKAREYRDADGNIHHHTRSYMERHGGGGETRPERRTESRSASDAKPRSAGARGSGSKAKAGGARSHVTTDPSEIRTWAESHGGKPAAVRRTHREGDVGIIRIMFPRAPNSEHDALEEISWDEFFQEFEARELALLYDDDSLFNKLIGRDTAEKRSHGDHDAAR